LRLPVVGVPPMMNSVTEFCMFMAFYLLSFFDPFTEMLGLNQNIEMLLADDQFMPILKAGVLYLDFWFPLRLIASVELTFLVARLVMSVFGFIIKRIFAMILQLILYTIGVIAALLAA